MPFRELEITKKPLVNQDLHMNPLEVWNYNETSRHLENPSSEFFTKITERPPWL